MEQYREQYRKETAQVHAPMDLIERTKAAVRAEEERILRERTIQSGMRQPEMTEPKVTYADYAKYGKKFSIHKWAYAVTAAAALLILVSVSLTMRGLKSVDTAPAADTAYSGSAESGAVYEESAEFDTGFVESVAETTVEMAEEEAADMEPAAAAGTESAAAEAPSGDRAPAVNEVQKAMSAADDTVGAEESNAAREEAKQNQETDREEDLLADMAAGKNSIIMEKVEKKPAFCNLPDTETYVYEEETFIVRKEKTGWVAYVETKNGAGYLFRGEMEDLEEFLEAAHENLLKEK